MVNQTGYKDSKRFLDLYNNITYPEFDYYSVNHLNLFSSLEYIDFVEINQKLTEIEQVLPAMKRIFAKPIIHLKDEDVLLPVEAVRLINNKTINHASNHPELWDDLTEDGIKPKKLLTHQNKDHYSIYENIVFAKAVDYSLNYVKHYIRMLSDMIYTNKKLEIDLLERENHTSYYLALSKLETGYIRSFSEYADVALKLISRMEFVYSALHARLRRPVYMKCHKYKGKLRLRRTNILAMDKDYKKIYKFLKDVFNNEIEMITEDVEPLDYLYYSKFITVFSAGHFNFQMNKEDKIDFNSLNIDMFFKNYSLNIKDTKVDNKPGILLTFKKEKEYKILLVPSVENIQIKSDIETHVLSPNFDTNDTLISIHNIDSFRRIQQIILKGMVYSSEKFDICPFCGKPLQEEESSYYCSNCRTEIRKETCKETKEKYFVTSIRNFRLKRRNTMFSKNSIFQKRFNEGLLHYRNITKITSDLSFICPKCNKVHKVETK